MACTMTIQRISGVARSWKSSALLGGFLSLGLLACSGSPAPASSDPGDVVEEEDGSEGGGDSPAGPKHSAFCSEDGLGGRGVCNGFDVMESSLDGRSSVLLNETLRLRFSADVELASIDARTVRIEDEFGVLARGTFSLGDAADVVDFRPELPLAGDYSDAGLRPDRSYRVTVVGRSDGPGPTVRAQDGRPLSTTRSWVLRTPEPSSAEELFVDVAGNEGPALFSTDPEQIDAIARHSKRPREGKPLSWGHANLQHLRTSP